MVNVWRKRITLRAFRQLRVPVDVEVRKQTPARRVTAAANIVLQPGEEHLIPIEYDSRPYGPEHDHESYHIESTHDDVFDALITRKSEQGMLAANTGGRSLRIWRGSQIGTLRRWSPEQDAYSVHELDQTNEDSHEETSGETETAPRADDLSKLTEEQRIALDYRIPDYGTNKPENVSTTKSAHGVQVANENPEQAAKLRSLLDKWNVYENSGIVPMPDDEKMRVDLVDGWQNQRKTTRQYPLSGPDRETLDETHDPLHIEGRLECAEQRSESIGFAGRTVAPRMMSGSPQRSLGTPPS